MIFVFFQAEDGIRDLVRSRGLGDVYKRQHEDRVHRELGDPLREEGVEHHPGRLDAARRVREDLSLIHI